ncbi:MAG: hypothetical protein U0559_00315 [Anaerolineae bacterium]
MTAYHADPAHAQLVNVVNYRLTERGYETVIRASGSTRTTAENFYIDIELQINAGAGNCASVELVGDDSEVLVKRSQPR